MKYPHARVEDVTDQLGGESFPDPYRWLEHETDEVRAWQREQAAIADAHVREWPSWEALKHVVARFSTPRHVSLPRFTAGCWFRIHAPADVRCTFATVSDLVAEEGRVLYDPRAEDPVHPPVISWIAPSPDGKTLALGVCTDGSEGNTIRLVDVATGTVLPEPPTQRLMDNWTGGVQWLPDSSGFFFSAILGAAIEFQQRVFLHRRLPRPETREIDVAWDGTNDYRMIVVSGDYAIATERLLNPVPAYVARLDAGQLIWRPFITGITGTVAGHALDGRYYAVTDVGAPRGRLVAIDLESDAPNDPRNWTELVAESEAVLRTVTPVADLLYLTEFVDTYSRVRVVDRKGREVGRVPLPARGAVMELPFPFMNLLPKGHPRKFVFGFSSLTVSPAIFSHTPGEERLEALQSPQVQLDDAVVEDCWARSKDGTRIPYHIVRRGGVSSASPQPTLIYAYGGYNDPLLPKFPGPLAAFVASGAVLVHAHLRGGGEFGLPWWQEGRMTRKQNCYDDLYAIAEDLIQRGRCSPRTLGVVGASNGGLMAAVAATQRPDLWAVAVPRVPLLDLIGACRDAYGRQAVIEELADVRDPADVRRLASFSPYHLIRPGTSYPAIFLDVGGTDPRCPAWHGRKFAARLQSVAPNAPVILRVWDNVGHGWATDKALALEQSTAWIAFTLRHLGVTQ